MKYLLFFALVILGCHRKGVVIVPPPKTVARSHEVTTIKMRYDSVKVDDGNYYRLYKLSNDSVLWINQQRHLWVKDTFLIPIKK